MNAGSSRQLARHNGTLMKKTKGSGNFGSSANCAVKDDFVYSLVAYSKALADLTSQSFVKPDVEESYR